MEPLHAAAKLLSDRLGDDHDLAVLREVVVAEPDRFEQTTSELLLGLLGHRRKELQAWSFPVGRRPLAEKTQRTACRFRGYWDAWVTEQRLTAALPDGSEAAS